MELEKELQQPFMTETLTNFLKGEDNNLKAYFTLRPVVIKNQVLMYDFELPKGFSEITNKQFYFKPVEQLNLNAIKTKHIINTWQEAMKEIKQFADYQDPDYRANLLEEIDALRLQYKIKQYGHNSQSLSQIQKTYFKNILIAVNRISPALKIPHASVRNMDVRDEIFRKMFHNQAKYDAFFSDYIDKKYAVENDELYTYTALLDLYEGYVQKGTHMQNIKSSCNLLKNKLYFEDLEEAKIIEETLQDLRSEHRIFNSKFKEPIYVNSTTMQKNK